MLRNPENYRALPARPLWLWRAIELWSAGLRVLSCSGWTPTQGQRKLLWSRWKAAKLVLRVRSWKHSHWSIVPGVQERLYLLADRREAALWVPPPLHITPPGPVFRQVEGDAHTHPIQSVKETDCSLSSLKSQGSSGSSPVSKTS